MWAAGRPNQYASRSRDGTSVSATDISPTVAAASNETSDDPPAEQVRQRVDAMVASGRGGLSRRTIGTPIWLAVVLILSLVATAIALVVAASTPRLDGAITAVLVASVVLGAAVAVTVAFAVVHKRRRTTNNGNWVYW